MSIKVVPASVFMAMLRGLSGTPYIWGWKSDKGLDCSGAVTYAYLLAGGDDIRQTHNSEALADECTKAAQPSWAVGCLAFYGKPHITHIMSVDTAPGGNGQLVAFGACGGDSSTTTLAAAKLRGAQVQYRKQVLYRPDGRFVGHWKRLDYSK